MAKKRKPTVPGVLVLREKNWDGLGRFIAQVLADQGLDVSTYGVLADTVHVNGGLDQPYTIDIYPQSED